MSVKEFTVKISPAEAANTIESEILRGSISGTLVDHYVRTTGSAEVHVLIMEKYYMRSNNRASVTATIDNFDGSTRVHVVAAGSSEGVFFRFDWGAGNSFATSVERSLEQYIIGE
ncbi:DUF6054 family protein [Sporosarcina highlanderae]|uniref:DUF6054 family protein n=1 Tax=Sporosarcina highlanderae TaxID=3035916 RepID=A0ABT8JML9_9BACL|nr:DUF6054 family protein [Sporosarcina highlanderae]MDN4606393.1 DUF6054 family protein [Sporosarcina highlanderae]